MNKWTFINDEFLPEEKARLHFSDLAIQRGYGIFDFFKVINHLPVFINDHLDRFYYSAGQMRLLIPYSKSELNDIIETTIQKNDIADCGIRLTLTGGYSIDGYQLSQPNLVISQHTIQPPTKEQYENGISLITFSHQRQLPQVKTIDYLMAIWLQPSIKENAADDVLYHQNGIVSECPRSNFFIVTKENKIVTPAYHILKGITRKKLMEAIAGKFSVEEKNLSLDEIRNAKEAFISSTTKKILPVAKIDGHLVGDEKNNVTHQLSDMFLQLQSASLFKPVG